MQKPTEKPLKYSHHIKIHTTIMERSIDMPQVALQSECSDSESKLELVSVVYYC